jgi:ubiquinone/menaquinone biosynthesis C-methylase UbiE
MERLAHADELLDGPLDDLQTLAGNLRDLGRLNAAFGGLALSRRAVDALVGEADGPLTILDVGTGGADIPVGLLADARRRGREVRITAVDSRPEVLAAAAAGRPDLATFDRLELVVADAAGLPFGDGSFDVVHASLLVHHLEPDAVLTALREMARVARLGVVVNDLSRGRRHLAWTWLMTRLMTTNRYTRADAPRSVRRAYTAAVLRALLWTAGLRPVAEFRTFDGHRRAIAAVAA